jgi:hypothetical protein
MRRIRIQQITWYQVDHFKSDRYYHLYCSTCLAKIPKFLIRHVMRLEPPYVSGGLPLRCEGCNRRS